MDGGLARLGITVTRKVGKAVRRNRVKRLIREWFRQEGIDMGPYDVVVIPNRDLPSELTVGELARDLTEALVSAGYRLGARSSERSGSTSSRSPRSWDPPAGSTRAAPSTRPR